MKTPPLKVPKGLELHILWSTTGFGSKHVPYKLQATFIVQSFPVGQLQATEGYESSLYVHHELLPS